MTEEISHRITITEEAAAHLRKKNKPYATIEHPDYRASAESIFIEVPEITNKIPKDELKYHHLVVSGIDIYLRRDVKLPKDEDVVIGLDSFLGLKFLKVSGFSAK